MAELEDGQRKSRRGRSRPISDGEPASPSVPQDQQSPTASRAPSGRRRAQGAAARRAGAGGDGRSRKKPLWERLVALANQVPDEEMVGRPTDVAEQHDHYLYGTPKKR